MSNFLIELIGYAGTILVTVSLAMSNIRHLRWLNLMGAICFMLYGIILNIVPVIVTNAFIVVTNLYYLTRILLSNEHFLIVPVTPVTSAFLPKFLQFYMNDLLRQFPQFKMDQINHFRHVFITRDMVPVGLFAYEYKDQDVIINLDYVIPSYRDYKTARFLFDEFGSLAAKKGYRRYVTYCHSKIYRRYLMKMGFTPDPSDQYQYTRNV